MNQVYLDFNKFFHRRGLFSFQSLIDIINEIILFCQWKVIIDSCQMTITTELSMTFKLLTSAILHFQIERTDAEAESLITLTT